MIDQIPQQPKPWYKGSILVKLTGNNLLILLLLIPSSWIQNLVDERQDISNQDA
jgi:inner membrane protein